MVKAVCTSLAVDKLKSLFASSSFQIARREGYNGVYKKRAGLIPFLKIWSI
jgi:hypothetical protein